MTLLSSFRTFENRFNDVKFLEHVKDEYGMYAIRFQNAKTGKEAFFCFKNSMNGKIVSVHHSLLVSARMREMMIVLGLGEKYFYMFTPADIERDCKINERENGVRMANFPITAGRSLQKPREKKKAEETKHLKPSKNLKPDGLLDTPMGKLLERELGPLERVG